MIYERFKKDYGACTKDKEGRLRPRRSRARGKVSDWRWYNKASSKKGINMK
jgi:hypothetical protein